MDQLQQLLRGEIETNEEVLQKYSHDASIFEVRPEGVVFPRDVEDLKTLVRYATRKTLDGAKISLTPRTGGTCMSGGPLTESWVVDMSRHFNAVEEANKETMTIRVGGGTMHLQVEAATHPHKLLFAPYTSSRDICGIGGMIGNNASGEKSVRFGPTSANVESLKVLLADGEEYEFGPLTREQLAAKCAEHSHEGNIYREIVKLLEDNEYLIDRNHPRVKKNAAGYALWELWNEDKTIFNLSRLFVGSQGTLGFTTEAVLKLIPFAPAQRMIVVPITDLSQLAESVQTMLKFTPDTCETFDSNTYDLAKIYHPEDAARANAADGKHMIVFAIYAGQDQAEADAKATEAKVALEGLSREVTWIETPEAVESFLLIRRKSFKMLLDHPHPGERALAFLEDTIVPIDHYGEFLAALEVILGEYNMTYTYAGHIGDGSIRLVPLCNMEAPDAADHIMELSRRVYDLVFAFGGSMSVDHNDGLIRTMFLERMYGKEMVALFAQVKELFDPLNIMNPGKKVEGDAAFAKAHIVKSNSHK